MALTELIKEMERRILDGRDSNREEETDYNGDEEDTREAASGTAAENEMTDAREGERWIKRY